MERDNAFTIHQRNVQSLAIEMFKTMKNENPSFMNNVFVGKRETGHNLKSKSTQDFESMNIHKVHTGEDSLRFLGCMIWKLIPQEIKEVESVDKFEMETSKMYLQTLQSLCSNNLVYRQRNMRRSSSVHVMILLNT